MRTLAAIAVAALTLLPASRDAQARPWKHDMGYCYVTGYTATGDRTATGTWPRAWSTVAVDPSTIPLGAYLSIGGLGTGFHAEDTGGAIKGCRVDVFLSTDAEAYRITGWRRVAWWR